jgi:hypothetical protein
MSSQWSAAGDPALAIDYISLPQRAFQDTAAGTTQHFCTTPRSRLPKGLLRLILITHYFRSVPFRTQLRGLYTAACLSGHSCGDSISHYYRSVPCRTQLRGPHNISVRRPRSRLPKATLRLILITYHFRSVPCRTQLRGLYTAACLSGHSCVDSIPQRALQDTASETQTETAEE